MVANTFGTSALLLVFVLGGFIIAKIFIESMQAEKNQQGIFSVISRNNGDVSEKILKLEDCANRLREEMMKINAFKRELPLCMLLLSEPIVEMEEELSQCRKSNSEPVLEDFTPLRNICKVEKVAENDISCREKMNWMSSVQLWNSDNNQLALKLDNTKKNMDEMPVPDLFLYTLESKISRDGITNPIGFSPYSCSSISGSPSATNFQSNLKTGHHQSARKQRLFVAGGKDMDELPVPDLSMYTLESKNSRDGITNPIGFSPQSCSSGSGSPSATNFQSNLKNGHHQSARKQRRCWSPELHRWFITVFQHFESAMPRQIRDLLQVNGLTNDEVKIHIF
ncbi:transcription factor [Orobanche minor]